MQEATRWRWAINGAPGAILTELRSSGYVSSAGEVQLDCRHLLRARDTIEISPGPGSYNSGHSRPLHFTNGQMDSITGPGRKIAFFL